MKNTNKVELEGKSQTKGGSFRQPHILLAYNLQIVLNEFFSENPNEKIGKDEFVELQRLVWNNVKKELGIEIGE